MFSKLKWGFCLLLFMGTLRADFVQMPWLGEFLEFHFRPSFQYRDYNSFDRGVNPVNYRSRDRFTNLDLGTVFYPYFDAQLGVEFADTSKQSFSIQSSAMQVRYQWLNDIGGDPISLTTGLQVRWVNPYSLSDVSCVYSSNWNFMLVTALGKELSTLYSWTIRGFGVFAVGQSNHGRPYIDAKLAFDAHLADSHRLRVFSDGYFGFGKTRIVDVSKFDGYANIFHQSVDVGLDYAYTISKVWGEISFSYSYRVFAKAFPERANTFLVRYDFPFSIF